jgi:hypothetical protein
VVKCTPPGWQYGATGYPESTFIKCSDWNGSSRACATFVGDGLMSSPRAECASGAPSVRRGRCGNGATARLLVHRQPKGAATDKPPPATTASPSSEITPASEGDSSRSLAQPEPSAVGRGPFTRTSEYVVCGFGGNPGLTFTIKRPADEIGQLYARSVATYVTGSTHRGSGSSHALVIT